jgi:glutathione S-transferase
MPSYKLIYFDIRGRGELIRLLFAQSGVPFEDCRIKHEEWPEFKPLTPFGSLPIVEIDGETLTGSTIIARYLAELPEFQLAGSNPFENAKIAAIGNYLNDLEVEIAKFFFEKDDAMIKKFFNEQVPKFYEKLEKLSSTNSSGYLWEDKLTWVDFYAYQLTCWIRLKNSPDAAALDKYANLCKLWKTIEALPNVAKWISERPDAHF